LVKGADLTVVVLMQAKHINDAQVLRDIAREAKLRDPDRVADDPNCCAEEVHHSRSAELQRTGWFIALSLKVPHTTMFNGE
jgi:hypothetical protein